MREDFEEALSARKYITDAKNKLQADYEELKKTAEADAAGTLERRKEGVVMRREGDEEIRSEN